MREQREDMQRGGRGMHADRRRQGLVGPRHGARRIELFGDLGEARRRGDNDAEAGQCIKQQQRRSRQPGTGPRQHLQMAGPGGEHQQ